MHACFDVALFFLFLVSIETTSRRVVGRLKAVRRRSEPTYVQNLHSCLFGCRRN